MNGQAPLRVIKLGGSLLDLPDLAERFHGWLARQSPAANLIVVGGGAIVEAIRALDRQHALGEAAAHRLSIRAMSLTAELASHLLGNVELATWPLDARCLTPTALPQATTTSACEKTQRACIVDVARFIDEDQRQSDQPLPESWRVTSDSIAARMAAVLRADELVLLKSTLPAAMTLAELAAKGFVDAYFSVAAVTRPLRCVDLRDAEAAERSLAD